MTPSVARFDSHFSVRSTAYALATVLKEIREGQTTVITADAIASQIGGLSASRLRLRTVTATKWEQRRV